MIRILKKAAIYIFISFIVVPVLYALIMYSIEFILPKKSSAFYGVTNYSSNIINNFHEYFYFVAVNIFIYYSYLFLIVVLVLYNLIVIIYIEVTNLKLSVFKKNILFLVLLSTSFSITKGFEDYFRTGNSALKWCLFLFVVSLFFTIIPNKWLLIDEQK